MRKVKQAGGVLLFGDMGLCRDDAEFQLHFGIKLAIGQYQKAKTKTLSRINTQRKAREGNILASDRLYGYKKAVVDGLTVYVIEKREAAIVRSIYRWYLENKNIREIVRMLKARNIEPPKSNWNECTVLQILQEESYPGVRHYDRTKTWRSTVANTSSTTARICRPVRRPPRRSLR